MIGRFCEDCEIGDHTKCDGTVLDDYDQQQLCGCDHFGIRYPFTVVESKFLPDGTVVMGFDGAKDADSAVFMVGTRPLTDIEYAGATARHQVRTGLADILHWCGQEVGPPPVREGRGRELITRARALMGTPTTE